MFRTTRNVAGENKCFHFVLLSFLEEGDINDNELKSDR